MLKFIGIIKRMFVHLFGKKKLARFESFMLEIYLKLHYYNCCWPPPLSMSSPSIISMSDGRIHHGGLSDRLRGIVSMYSFCKRYGYDFKLNFVDPFCITDYLMPNKHNWIIKSSDIDRVCSTPIVIRPFSSSDEVNCYSYIYDTIKHIRSYKQLHVYTNITADKHSFSTDFNELFKPSDELQILVDKYIKEIGGEYLSITFRFQQLLGDLSEGNYKILKPNERRGLIDKCCLFINKIHKQYPEHKVLLTSDSTTFLDFAKQCFSFVYVAPGKVIHMDYTSDKQELAYIKSFVDMYMISRASRAYAYATGDMYKESAFAETSALIGNIPFIKIIE